MLSRVAENLYWLSRYVESGARSRWTRTARDPTSNRPSSS